MASQAINILLGYLVRSERQLFYERNYGDFIRLEAPALVISEGLLDLLGIEVISAERRSVFDSSKAALQTGSSGHGRQLESSGIHI